VSDTLREGKVLLVLLVLLPYTPYISLSLSGGDF